MNNNFNLDELEEFLSDSAEQHRMYPSDKVWRNIDRELHGNKKWPALTFGAIVTGALITAGLVLVHPDKSLLKNNESSFKETNKDQQATNIEPTADKAIVVDFYTRKSSRTAQVNQSSDLISNPAFSLPFNHTEPAANNIEAISEDVAPEESGKNDVQPDVFLPASAVKVAAPVETDISGQMVEEVTGLASRKIGSLALVTDNKKIDFNNSKIESTVAEVAGRLVPKPQKKSRWSSFFYLTPSISYRYLAEAKYYDYHLLSGPIAPNLTHNVNSFVNQKPIGGFEAGGGYMYQLSNSLRIRVGLQANLRGYRIEAYSSKRQAAAIVLDRGMRSDSIMAVSSVSNMQGAKPIEVNNRYFELSMPVTLDLKLAGFKKIEIYVAGGLQPTYQFNSNMYMVSNDYKSYVQSPDLTRKFNINTSLEAYISYKTGRYSWQLGPQLRYQLMPGTIKEYPIREHLFDYGIKIGVVKSLF